MAHSAQSVDKASLFEFDACSRVDDGEFAYSTSRRKSDDGRSKPTALPPTPPADRIVNGGEGVALPKHPASVGNWTAPVGIASTDRRNDGGGTAAQSRRTIDVNGAGVQTALRASKEAADDAAVPTSSRMRHTVHKKVPPTQPHNDHSPAVLHTEKDTAVASTAAAALVPPASAPAANALAAHGGCAEAKTPGGFGFALSPCAPMPSAHGDASSTMTWTTGAHRGQAAKAATIGHTKSLVPQGASSKSVSSDDSDASRFAERQARRRSKFDSAPAYKKDTMRMCFREATTFDTPVGYIDTHCHLDMMLKQVCGRRDMSTMSQFMQRYGGTVSPALRQCIPDWCRPCDLRKAVQSGHLRTVLGDDMVAGAAYGVHPHWVDEVGAGDEMEATLTPLWNNATYRCVAVGECGIDYSSHNRQPASVQQAAFGAQLALNKRLPRPLPVVVHCRPADSYDYDGRGDAETDALDIVKQCAGPSTPIHRHCFTGDWPTAQRWLREGNQCYIGFTPVVAQDSARGRRLHSVIKETPLDRMLIETDAPFFVPDSHALEAPHMKCSHPGVGIVVAMRIAEAKAMQLADVLHAIRENTTRLYGV